MARPVSSIIRQRMVDILYHKPELTGYDIFKIYIGVYGKVSLRSMYYHLKKGQSTGEFKISKIVKEQGDFSWGNVSNKIYYELGENAVAQPDKNIHAFIKELDSIKNS